MMKSTEEKLKPEIERGIKESRASVVVLSENYATSTWCLDELWLILEQRRYCNHFVLPIFYHVDTSDVGKHQKTFAIEVKPYGRWTDDNVTRWKAALKEVVRLAGEVASGPETKLLADIVDIIYNKLDLKLLSLPPNLMGMDTQDKDISSWLKQSDAEFLAICGMGGSGKTTLAKYILNSNFRKFENISFVENIGSRCKEPHDLLQLQEQLLQDILGGKNRKIPSVSRGTCKIEEALQMKKALIVLDDIDEQDQLVALLGTGKINTQSKIIITRIFSDEWFQSRSWRYQMYNMKLLDDDESLELLSLHAFRSKIPMEGFEELAVHAIQYCDGNPLAVEVLGSNLSKKNTIPLWRSELNLLEREIDSGVQRVLIRSYNSLPYESDKELFLHIACFFIGKDVDYVVKILEPDYSASSRIKTLTDRRLLSVSSNKKLMMHRVLQEMGRTIVREESPNHPAKRSRVWRNEEAYAVLRKGKGSKTMEGLALDMQMLREENYIFKQQIYETADMSKASVEFASSALKETIKSDFTSQFSNRPTKDLSDRPPVASPYSFSGVAPPWERYKIFDVYLSHRSGGASELFTYRLYNALEGAGLRPFKDDDWAPRGEDQRTIIDRRMSGSRASIVIVSEDYVYSRWCLDRLLLILERRRNSNHFVLPVFFEVDCLDVWRQQNSLALQGFPKSVEWMEKVDRWDAALTEIATLPTHNVYWDDLFAGKKEIVSTVHVALYSSSS